MAREYKSSSSKFLFSEPGKQSPEEAAKKPEPRTEQAETIKKAAEPSEYYTPRQAVEKRTHRAHIVLQPSVYNAVIEKIAGTRNEWGRAASFNDYINNLILKDLGMK